MKIKYNVAKLRVTLVMIMVLTTAVSIAGSWTYVFSSGGVEVYWKVDKEAKDQYCSKLKIVNTNNYKVKVKVKAMFSAPGQPRWKEKAAGTHYLKPGQSKAGNWGGLYFYPWRGKVKPSSGGAEIAVSKQ